MLKRLRYILYLSIPALFLFSCSKEEKKGSVWDDPSMWYQSESPFSPDKTDVIYFVSTDVLSARDKEETNDDKDNLNMKMKAGGYSFDIEYADNNTAEAFRKMLPITLKMEELNGNEKYCYMDSSLPAASGNPGTINAGDIMLYGNNCVVVFYETFNTSYSYTRIGRIKNTANLKKALGSGNVEVTFE